MAADSVIRVTLVVSAGPREVIEDTLELADGCTVQQALQASVALRGLDATMAQSWATGVWGSTVTAAHVLRDGDRLELYRPLRVDPKVARRTRFQAQGARTAGLFARRRAGGKAGY